MGKFAPRIFNELLKGDACVSKATLKRACAQAEFLGDVLQRRTLPANDCLRASFTCSPTFMLVFRDLSSESNCVPIIATNSSF
jgi:hypothetical protein